MTIAAWIWVMMLVIGVVMFFIYSFTGKFCKCLFFSAFTGLGTLGAIWLLSRFFTVNLTITPLSVIISAILGIPGVIGMLIVNII